VAALPATRLIAQGPASCGFHLDFVGGNTTTHAAVADMPGAPGTGVGLPPGAPGSPYTAYTAPAAPFTLFLGVPRGTLGPAPLGAGSCLTLVYSFEGTLTPLPASPPLVPPCQGGPLIIGVLPIHGTVVDSCGLLSGNPLNFIADPGWPNRIMLTGTYSPLAPPLIMLQAVMLTGAGQLAVSNALAIKTGTNPAETSQTSALATCGATTLSADMDVNGFIDFLPGAATGGGCDTTGTSQDLGCATATAHARPRIDVCHADWNLGVPTVPGLVADLSTETRAAGPGWPAATIFRWKHLAVSGTTPTSATSSFACELLGDGRIVVVRSKILTVDLVGIGPGIAGQGYGGPPSILATCSFGAAGLSFSTTYDSPFAGSPGGAIHMDSTPFSDLVHNLAIVFTPGAGAPTPYTVQVY
jgi:hypothetical protein